MVFRYSKDHGTAMSCQTANRLLSIRPEEKTRGSLGNFHEARFGTLWFAVSELVRIEHALRFAWSKDAYNSGAKADGKDDRSLKVDVADEAIRSQTFWGYICMLDCVGSVFDVLARFGEGCVCAMVMGI